MSIPFVCPECGHQMAIPERYAGRELFCTSCKAKFTAPAGNDPTVRATAALGVPCPTCGSILPADSVQCPHCAQSVQSFSTPGGPFKRPGVITILAVLDFLGGGVMFLGAAATVVAVAVSNSAEGAGLIGFAVVYFLIGALYIATGVGLWRLRPWGRSIQIALSIIGLLGFPIGTIISALILYYLYRPGIKLLFSSREPGDLMPQERALVDQMSSSGTTLAAVIAVCLLLVFGCGLISAIAIPNLLNAINRGRQKRTMADMRTLAISFEAYKVDHGTYPLSMESIDDATPHIQPTYIRLAPTNDGWDTSFEVWSDDKGANFAIVSYGRDKTEGPQPGGVTNDFDADIVIANGLFTQWPEGIQTE